jgi:hypothetical protein
MHPEAQIVQKRKSRRVMTWGIQPRRMFLILPLNPSRTTMAGGIDRPRKCERLVLSKFLFHWVFKLSHHMASENFNVRTMIYNVENSRWIKNVSTILLDTQFP